MPNLAASAETDGAPLIGSDIFRISRGAGNRRVTADNIKTFMSVVIGIQFLTPEEHANGETLGGGSAVLLNSLGYTNVEAAAIWDLVPSIDVTQDTIDLVSIYQASMIMANGGRQNALYLGCYGSRNYVINRFIDIPKAHPGKANVHYIYNGNGCTITTTSATQDVFRTLPVDQAEATNVTTLTNITFREMAIRNQGTTKGSGQAGLRIGGRALTVEDFISTGFDYPYDIQHCLHSYFKKATALDAETTGHLFRSGTWTDATITNSACNDIDVMDSLSKTARGSDYGFAILASSDVNLYGCTTEGNVDDTDLPGQPKAGVFIDTQNSSVVKGTCQVHGLHGEQSYVDGLIHIKSREGIFQLSDISNQFQGLYAGGNKNLYKLESYAGFVYARLDNFAHFLPNIKFDLENSSCLPIFCYPWSATAAILDNAAFWATYQPTLSDLQKSVYPP